MIHFFGVDVGGRVGTGAMLIVNVAVIVFMFVGNFVVVVVYIVADFGLGKWCIVVVQVFFGAGLFFSTGS